MLCIKEEDLKIINWIKLSDYRYPIMLTLGKKLKTIASINRDSNIEINQIEEQLKFLEEKNIVKCINKESDKWNLYQLTGMGLRLLSLMRNQ